MTSLRNKPLVAKVAVPYSPGEKKSGSRLLATSLEE
jgi:hypothetical protein